MKKCKLLIILVIILFITGCTYNEKYEISNNSIYLVDEETCVQYIKFYDYKGISVRLKANGELNAKYPGGVEAQKEKLEAEGHIIIQRGRKHIRYYVQEYENALFHLQWPAAHE